MKTRSRKSVITMAVAASLFLSSSLYSAEYITNGDFETGDLSGWISTDSGSGLWVINDGTFDPAGPGVALAPISGTYDIVSWQYGPGLHLKTQPISLPTAITSATLRWADRIRNYGAVYSDHNQEFRVLVKDTSGNVIQEVYSTNPGDALMQLGPNNRSFDLTALVQGYEGQQVVVSFEEQDNLGYFNATIDDVSLNIEQLTLSCSTGGFEAPFNVPLSLSSKEKRSIPLKMQLVDQSGALYTNTDITPPVVNISYTPLTGGVAYDVSDDILSSGKANDDNIFRWDEEGQKWIYNLGTKTYQNAGMYTVTAVPGSSDYVVDETCNGVFQRN